MTAMKSTTVLFVCVHNAGRSQMAEAIFNKYAPTHMKAISAGTQPGTSVNPMAIDALKELDIDVSSHKPKLLTAELINKSNKVITMGCGVSESCPTALGLKIDEDWGLDDPAGQPIEIVRQIRDLIVAKVKELISSLSKEEK